MKNPTSYDLSRSFWNWAFENPELIRPQHSAIYFFAIEHCNRLGWKEKFGFPSQMTMDAIGISKYQTYIKYFNDLIEFGFLNLVQKSKNQYSANIISLNYALPKNGKALDKALIKHGVKQTQKQLESNHDSDGSINKQYNKQTINNKLNIEDFKKELKTDHSELERQMMHYKINVNQINTFIDQFDTKYRAEHNEYTKYKVHFKNWLPFQVNKIDPRTESPNFLQPDKKEKEFWKKEYKAKMKKGQENKKPGPMAAAIKEITKK